MDALVFAVLSDTLAELRRVPARTGRGTPVTLESLRQHFTVWERGVLLNAACFLIDFPRTAVEIPLLAFSIAHRVVEAEMQHGFAGELEAASVAGGPWRGELSGECLRCGRPGTWRRILNAPELPVELRWRYERPENHIPICRRCASRQLMQRWEPRFEIARALWGPRFEALLRWHHARDNDVLPCDWDLAAYPLWPGEFGGRSWRTGSGALAVCEPRPHYDVARSRTHLESLERLLGPERAARILSCCAGADYDWQQPSPDAQAVGALS